MCVGYNLLLLLRTVTEDTYEHQYCSSYSPILHGKYGEHSQLLALSLTPIFDHNAGTNVWVITPSLRPAAVHAAGEAPCNIHIYLQ